MSTANSSNSGQSESVLHEMEEGDEVLWGDRSQPLTVTDVGGTSEGEDHYAVVRGPRGGNYTIKETVNPNGSTYVRTDKEGEISGLRIETRAGDTDDEDEGDEEEEMSELEDGRVIGQDVGMKWPDPEPSATVKSADDYISGLVGDPFTDYHQFLEDSGLPEGELPSNPISKFLQNEDPTWTFVDELLAFGQDVPKTVNNWHLVDYGVITDSAVDNTRKMAWFNTEEEELLVLAAINDGDGPIWLVYHSDDPDENEDRDPDLETRDPYEALDRVKDTLYDGEDEVDISVQEEPDGTITVFDAISDTELAERVLSLQDADPFGVRQYVNEATAPKVIQDADRKLFDTIEAARGQTSRLREALNTWWRNNKGELGRALKVLMLEAISGISRRFKGIDYRPIIEYNRLGVVAEYKYKGSKRGQQLGRHTADRDAWTGELTINPQKFNLHEKGPYTRLGIDYASIVRLAEWANVNQWAFNIPGTDQQLHAGSTRHRSRSSSSSSSSSSGARDMSDVEDAASRAGLSGSSSGSSFSPGVDKIGPDDLARVVAGIGGDKNALSALVYAATNDYVVRLDKQDIDFAEKYETDQQKKASVNDSVFDELADEVDSLGFDLGDRDALLEVVVDAVRRSEVDGKNLAAAVNAAIENSDYGPDELSTTSDNNEVSFGSFTLSGNLSDSGGSDDSDDSPGTPVPTDGGETGEESTEGVDVALANLGDEDESGGGGSSAPEPEGKGGEDGGDDGLSQDERARTGNLLSDIEDGQKRVNELADHEMDLLRKADPDLTGFDLDAETQIKLEHRLEEKPGLITDASAVLDERAENSGQDDAPFDEVSQMSDEERSAAVGAMYGSGSRAYEDWEGVVPEDEDVAYGTRDDEMDRL